MVRRKPAPLLKFRNREAWPQTFDIARTSGESHSSDDGARRHRGSKAHQAAYRRPRHSAVPGPDVKQLRRSAHRRLRPHKNSGRCPCSIYLCCSHSFWSVDARAMPPSGNLPGPGLTLTVSGAGWVRIAAGRNRFGSARNPAQRSVVLIEQGMHRLSLSLGESDGRDPLSRRSGAGVRRARSPSRRTPSTASRLR
jgi:hypothetical protein